MYSIGMNTQTRKIIHIDMDCFYAAIEMRDHPELRDKPIAVGGSPGKRGVLCTANYTARQYGVHSAMASSHALRLCPELVLLPVNMEKYREESRQIRSILNEYTDLIEPLSLDEAFLDVTHSDYLNNSATLIAKEIKTRIQKKLCLTASAGVAPNKFLAKIASDWQKPNGLFVITPEKIDDFIRSLPVKKIFGVGKVTAQKLHNLGIYSCQDLQKLSLSSLSKNFGLMGQRLYESCRGIDERPVENDHVRKSVSVEHTYAQDLPDIDHCLAELPALYMALKQRLNKHSKRKIHKQFVKVKFHDFEQTTVESISQQLNLNLFSRLTNCAYQRQYKPVRLLGIGVSFKPENDITQIELEF